MSNQNPNRHDTLKSTRSKIMHNFHRSINLSLKAPSMDLSLKGPSMDLSLKGPSMDLSLKGPSMELS